MAEKDKDAKKSIIFVLKIIAFIFLCVIYAVLIFFFGLSSDAIRYGKYEYIGVIIIAAVFIGFVISLTFALFNTSGKTKKIITSLICVALIALIIPISDLTEKICSIPYAEFSTENWNNQTSDNLRQYMIPDLEKKYKIVGMDISEVDKLLDLDNWGPSNYGREYYHRIGSAHTFLVICYDENGKVTKVETTNDASRG